MEDERIVQLYWDRDERAIAESSLKYGAYCHAVAKRILDLWADAQECVNDTWIRAWGAMPPQKPQRLSVFLGKITRNLAFDRYRRENRQKRGGYSLDPVLDELSECVSGKEDPVEAWHARELAEDINRFLFTLPKERRLMFVQRYWYAMTVGEIAERFRISENTVSVYLGRIRKQLKTYLNDRGYEL